MDRGITNANEIEFQEVKSNFETSGSQIQTSPNFRSVVCNLAFYLNIIFIIIIDFTFLFF